MNYEWNVSYLFNFYCLIIFTFKVKQKYPCTGNIGKVGELIVILYDN